MSQNQNLEDLKSLLTKWKSHNEVHARPADKIMYELLDGILNMMSNEQSKPASTAPVATTQDDPPGGNNPEAPDIP